MRVAFLAGAVSGVQIVTAAYAEVSRQNFRSTAYLPACADVAMMASLTSTRTNKVRK